LIFFLLFLDHVCFYWPGFVQWLFSFFCPAKVLDPPRSSVPLSLAFLEHLIRVSEPVFLTEEQTVIVSVEQCQDFLPFFDPHFPPNCPLFVSLYVYNLNKNHYCHIPLIILVFEDRVWCIFLSPKFDLPCLPLS